MKPLHGFQIHNSRSHELLLSFSENGDFDHMKKTVLLFILSCTQIDRNYMERASAMNLHNQDRIANYICVVFLFYLFFSYFFFLMQVTNFSSGYVPYHKDPQKCDKRISLQYMHKLQRETTTGHLFSCNVDSTGTAL